MRAWHRALQCTSIPSWHQYTIMRTIYNVIQYWHTVRAQPRMVKRQCDSETVREQRRVWDDSLIPKAYACKP